MTAGYDQWKTASPHDDQIDWGEAGVECPGCGCDAPEEQGNDGDHVELWCPDCGHKFKVTVDAAGGCGQNKKTE